MKDTFLIVDGNSLMHRAFHALPIMNTDGIYTNAIYGFFNMIFKVIMTENVRWMAICFDEHGPTFRHTIYPEYKAGRNETPEELKQQFATIRETLTEMKIKWYALQGWEADDLLGTLSLYGEKEEVRSLLLTGDRDALQLIGNGTELLFTRKGISEAKLFDPIEIYEEFGFRADQVTDWKGLAGDNSDHIPGVPGVGDKTAVKLLKQYETLENVLAHADEIKGKLGENIRQYHDQALFCKQIATIRRDAPITFSLSQCVIPDANEFIRPLKKLQLNSLVRRIQEKNPDKIQKKEEEPSNDSALFSEPTEIYTKDALAEWFMKLREKDRPIAFHLTDQILTIATSDKEWIKVYIAKDLLTPGIDPEELFNVISKDMTEHPCLVHDSKKWMKLFDKLRIRVPETYLWDTMIAAYLLDAKADTFDFRTLSETDDARGLLILYGDQKKKIETLGMTELINEIELPLSAVLFEMEKTGFRIDIDFLKQTGHRLLNEIDELKTCIIDLCGVGNFNLNSTQQLGEVLFEKLMLPHGKKTKKGYSTSVEVLENIRDLAPELIDSILRYRQLTKLNSTYIESLIPLADQDGRIHSFFDQVATATGRISSSEPNLQNIPVRTKEGKEIRKAFIPKDGWVILDADYSQIELRLMAHYSGDSSLVQAFQDGKDIHTQTASEIFEIPIEQVTGEIRSRAKAVNFGLIYGISSFGLSKNTGVSRKEAEEFINRYFMTYQGVKKFMDQAVSDGIEKGYTTTLMGRRRDLPELKSDKSVIREFGKRIAINTPIQGTAADIIKKAMVLICRKIKEEGMKSRLILQVHDELLIECPPEELEKSREIIRDIMENSFDLKVPLIAEINSGLTWAEAK